MPTSADRRSKGSHGGTWAARVGSTSPSSNSSISQQIALPAGSPQLSFWVKVVCPDTIEYDWASVQVKSASGAVLATPLARTCSNSGTWVQETADLSAFAGTTVTLQLDNHDDNYPGDPTYTLYDDDVVSGGGAIQTVFIILMENHNWSSIAGSASAPYINNTLLPQASSALHYQNPPGMHPSEPNYLWLEAGTNFGVLDDSALSVNHQSTSQHLVTLLQSSGISWRSYQEGTSGTTYQQRGGALQLHHPQPLQRHARRDGLPRRRHRHRRHLALAGGARHHELGGVPQRRRHLHHLGRERGRRRAHRHDLFAVQPLLGDAANATDLSDLFTSFP